jgi:hypothetical protein
VVGGSTEPLSALLGSRTTTASNLGGIIATIGGFQTSGSKSGTSISTPVLYTGTAGSNATQFTGAAGRVRGAKSLWAWGAGFMTGMAVLGWL